jgi:hypothetical protein
MIPPTNRSPATGSLKREPLIVIGWFLALAQATILIMLALWQHGVIGPGASRTSSDFVSFYAAGKLALAGTPALAYDQAAHYAMQHPFAPEGAPYQFFFYPPVFLLLCAPLALPAYYAAFYGFEIATLALFLWTARAVAREASWTAAGPILAFPAVWWTFGLGQNAFLTAALFGGFTLLVDRRPVLAGVLLGLLCYKPHFGLIAPVALIAGGHWRAFLAAGGTVAVLVLLSSGLFGIETWQAWWEAFRHSDAVYSTGRIDYGGIVTPFGAARLLGFGPSTAYAVQGAATLAIIGLVFAIWRRERRLPLRAAALLAAMPLAVPLVLLYDMLPLALAIAWLTREAKETGLLPLEAPLLTAILLIALFGYTVASFTGIPLAPVASLLTLGLVARRVWRA